MHIIAIALAFILLNGTGMTAFAQQRHIHSGAGVSPTQLPFWTARDLGIFDKYSGCETRPAAAWNQVAMVEGNLKTPCEIGG